MIKINIRMFIARIKFEILTAVLKIFQSNIRLEYSKFGLFLESEQELATYDMIYFERIKMSE